MALNFDMNTMNPTERLVMALAMAMTAQNEAASDEWAEKAAEFAKDVPNSRGREDIRQAAWAKADEIRLQIEAERLPEPTTPAEALTRTLFLAIMATDEDQASRAMALAEDFAAELTEDEIEACKTAAQAQAFGPQYVAAEQAARHTINRAMSR